MVSIIEALQELKTDEARLHWLLDFVNRKDLLDLSPEQVEELADYCTAFSRAGTEADVKRDLTPAGMFELQQAAITGLRMAIQMDNLNRSGGPEQRGRVGWRLELDRVVRHTVRAQPAGFEGPLRTVVLATAGDLVAADHERRIEICAKPGCGRFFLRFGRQKYCSQNCADTDRQKRYRDKSEEKSVKVQSKSPKKPRIA